MLTIDEEIALTYNILISPVGYVLNILEGELQIRPIYNLSDIGWEMSWHEIIDGYAVDTFKNFTDPLMAATFFVEKRHELQIGMDMHENESNE